MVIVLFIVSFWVSILPQIETRHAGMKTQKKSIPYGKMAGKEEKQEDYHTTVAYICSRCRVVILSLFCAIIPYGILLACFHPCLLVLLQLQPYLKLSSAETFPLVLLKQSMSCVVITISLHYFRPR